VRGKADMKRAGGVENRIIRGASRRSDASRLAILYGVSYRPVCLFGLCPGIVRTPVHALRAVFCGERRES
jgi:hypothetical protein